MIVVMKAQTEKVTQELSKKKNLFTKRNTRPESETVAPESVDGIKLTSSASLNARHDFGSSISAEDREKYETQFRKMAKTGSATISSAQVCALLGPDELGLDVKSEEIEAHIHQMLSRTNFSRRCDVDHLNLEFFLSLVSQMPKKPQAPYRSIRTMLTPRIPIDPDSLWKQIWDLFCLLLLLYCSFSVPYGIAFLGDSNGSLNDLEISSISVDIIFMVDIVFSFVTAVEVDGVMVRNIRRIAALYVESWFFPDFFGSFPFDTVIAALLENQRNLNSSNYIRFLKFIRMLKLIRAIKFMNKMNKLKNQEGFEVCFSTSLLSTPTRCTHRQYTFAARQIVQLAVCWTFRSRGQSSHKTGLLY